jgi:SAM-dependent methyltransferase
MSSSDLFNLTLLENNEEVDQINKKFYGRYNYPWPPSVVPAFPGEISTLFLNQDIGSWAHERVQSKPKIWVAGCGTNQALLTALKFPDAEVYATDISTQSLDTCRRNARHIGVKNLFLEEKSLNKVNYEEEFDYIICTGVVHHNANPEATLKNISRALKKTGILEFMVYNYYHRLLTTACQKAIRNFYDSSSSLDLEMELTLVKKLIADFHYKNLMASFLLENSEAPEAYLADNLVQPVEYSYTVESLGRMANNSNLEYLLNCQNQFDIETNAFTWNMKFEDEYLREHYNSLPDIRRWQISNLLMFNESPMLWFYFQRRDSPFIRKTEQQVCADFLESRFRRNFFQLKNFLLDEEGNYKPGDRPVRYPVEAAITDPLIKKIYDAVTPQLKMSEIFNKCSIPTDFYTVNNVRIKLSTSGYPYILADHRTYKNEYRVLDID